MKVLEENTEGRAARDAYEDICQALQKGRAEAVDFIQARMDRNKLSLRNERRWIKGSRGDQRRYHLENIAYLKTRIRLFKQFLKQIVASTLTEPPDLPNSPLLTHEAEEKSPLL